MYRYYDILLGAIPVLLMIAFVISEIVGISTSVTVPIAGVATVGVIAHGMFFNPPKGMIR